MSKHHLEACHVSTIIKSMSDYPSIHPVSDQYQSTVLFESEGFLIANLPTKTNHFYIHFWDYSFSHNHGSGSWRYLKGNCCRRDLFFHFHVSWEEGFDLCLSPKNISGVPAALLDLGLEGDAVWYAKNTIWQL